MLKEYIDVGMRSIPSFAGTVWTFITSNEFVGFVTVVYTVVSLFFVVKRNVSKN